MNRRDDDFKVYRENMEALDEVAGLANVTAERALIMFRGLTRQRDEARDRIAALEKAGKERDRVLKSAQQAIKMAFQFIDRRWPANDADATPVLDELSTAGYKVDAALEVDDDATASV